MYILYVSPPQKRTECSFSVRHVIQILIANISSLLDRKTRTSKHGQFHIFSKPTFLWTYFDLNVKDFPL